MGVDIISELISKLLSTKNEREKKERHKNDVVIMLQIKIPMHIKYAQWDSSNNI